MNQNHTLMRGDKRLRPYRKQLGQSAIEYTVVCAALALALFVDLNSSNSALKNVLDNFSNAYKKISYALSLPT